MVKNSIFEKDFDLKNRKAMKGASESEEVFAKRNKKAWGKLEKKVINELFSLLMFFMILFAILTTIFILLTRVIL